MVCHWSRMRPVFSRSGRAAVVSVRSVGTSGAMKRALKSLAKKPPSAKKRACGSLPCRTGHCTGAIASKSLSDSDCSAPMSKSRAPSFSNAERAACSRKISAAELKPKAAPKPRRLATSPMIHQSGMASPGAERNARCREMRRSELVTVPDFSPQACAGSSTCAPTSTVSLEMTFSETTNSSSFFRASRTASAFGSDTAGLVPITHSALISPRAMASNICDRLQPLMGGDARRLPEPAHAIDIRRRKSHMGGELVGEPADLAAAHRIGLPGQRERRRARLADPPGREMAVDDGVDLVGALRRLVDALRIERHHARRIGKHLKERRDVLLGEAGRQRGGPDAARDVARARDGVVEAGGVARDVVAVERAVIGKMHQQPAEQRRIGAGLQSQEQIVVADRYRSGADRSPPCARRASACWRACAGTAPDGTRPRWSRPAPEDPPRRDLHSSPAPCRRRRRGDGRQPNEAMQSRELVSTLALPMKPFISLLAT